MKYLLGIILGFILHKAVIEADSYLSVLHLMKERRYEGMEETMIRALLWQPNIWCKEVEGLGIVSCKK